MDLSSSHIRQLRETLETGATLTQGLARTVGGTQAGSGLWRLYSGSWPAGGVDRWNTEWKRQWGTQLREDVVAFGEDIFGNQLVIVPSEQTVFLWNHETAELTDLECDVVTLLETVVESGVDWVDLYRDGSLAVARRQRPVSADSHLHWTTPLVLGGAVTDANVSVLERKAHLEGHAKLWLQIQGIPPGTSIIPK